MRLFSKNEVSILNRKEKVDYLIKMIEEIEGVLLDASYFEDYPDARIDDEIDWFDYLMTK